MEIIKSIFYDYWKNIVLFILAFLLFKSCQSNNESRFANETLKTEVKDLVNTADKIAGKNRQLRDTISILEAKKQKVKTEIVYIQNKSKKDIEKVSNLSTVELSYFYAKRYDNQVEITNSGVVLIDTVAKQNVIELIQKDACFIEIELVKDNLKITEQQSTIKDTMIGNLDKSNLILKSAIIGQDKIISNTEKSLKKEKAKKTFWQFSFGAVLLGASYLLIQK